MMAVEEVRDYMENGNIKNSVNYPACDMGICTAASRIAILHKNVKSTIAKYSAVLGETDLNISDMTNKSKGDYAYSLIDLDAPVTKAAVEQLKQIEGVIKVRVIR